MRKPIFSTVPLPDGSRYLVMDEKTFRRALKAAGRVLRRSAKSQAIVKEASAKRSAALKRLASR